jgi:hypothetical protein
MDVEAGAARLWISPRDKLSRAMIWQRAPGYSMPTLLDMAEIEALSADLQRYVDR